MKVSNIVAGVCATAMLAGCGGPQSLSAMLPQESSSQRPFTNQSFHIVHPFNRTKGDGANPASDLINVKGTLYGTTVKGGSHNGGTVFSITPDGTETVIYSFGAKQNDGYAPVAALLNVNGTFYGTTSAGGTNNGGTVFKITPSGTETIVHDFSYLGNGNPRAALTNVGGTLYGTTAGLEGYTCGQAFSLTTSGTFKTLHTFGKGSDGCFSVAPLLNVNGTLYGTTYTGGDQDSRGTVFTIGATGKYTRLYNFGTNPNDGGYSSTGLINVQGTLYGTTTEGGNGNSGTVFSITTDGTEKVVHSFGGNDGVGPAAALKNVKGVLYGTTQAGGANNLGTIFKVTKNGTQTVVHSFAKGEGVNPVAGVLAVNGTLYGTTYGSDPGKLPKRSFGNIFSLTP